jgi:very-short-patch-repair endonuclease
MSIPVYLAFLFGSRRIIHRADLRRAGMSGQDITEAVRRQDIIRVRRDHYARPSLDQHTLEAVRVGGRLACVSAAAELGLFAFDHSHTHLHLDRDASRLRSPHTRFRPLTELPRDGVQLHWWPLIDAADGNEFCVGVKDALVQIIRCQEPRFALAALDLALHERRIRPRDLDEVFASVPVAHQFLRPQINARSEAGQETVVRQLILDAGLRCEIQVSIEGVGRVDLLVEDCVVVEADSQGFHKEWDQHTRDRTRDLLLAERGYLSLRVLYQHIMFEPETVVAAIRRLVAISRAADQRTGPTPAPSQRSRRAPGA